MPPTTYGAASGPFPSLPDRISQPGMSPSSPARRDERGGGGPFPLQNIPTPSPFALARASLSSAAAGGGEGGRRGPLAFPLRAPIWSPWPPEAVEEDTQVRALLGHTACQVPGL